MKQKMWKWIGGLLVALLVVGAAGTAVAYAQAPTSVADMNHGHGPGGGRGPLGTAELEAAAKALGMTTDELSAALQSGKTLEEIATDQGVDYQSVKDAISAARASEMRTQIERAVTDGTITQEKANWLLEGLDKGFLNDGHGFGGRHGHGLGGDATKTPSTQSTPAQ
jgi:hypothetical protein